MCGIAGFQGQGTTHDLEQMIQSIGYRGPDYQGTDLQQGVGLAHARLSIIDLRPEGNQPMQTADGQLRLIFNGEIYNYLDIRKDLLATGKYNFRSSSDTEVVLYAYREYGLDFLKRISGMFALAIYDAQTEELLLARDRAGKKPLYYTETSTSFVFGSELKALLKHPNVSKELNLEALNQYLTFDYVPTPNSIIKNVHKMEAGHYLMVKNHRVIKSAPYWEHQFSTNNNISFESATAKLDELLDAATARRLMSDVPLGVFLSGGLDSSAIAYYAQKNSSKPIETFSIGFEDRSYDEADYARQIAQHLGTSHHQEILTAAQTVKLVEEIYPKVDEPFADASLIPTTFLSHFTRQHVTVALGGDGSDEFLGGYPTFISDHFKGWLKAFPAGMHQLTSKVVGAVLPASDKNISFDFKVKQFLRGGFAGDNHIHQLWLGGFVPQEKQQLFKPAIYDQLQDKAGLQLIDKHFAQSPAQDDFHRIAYYYYKTYLLDDILVKVDRASMYNSLEVRAPFLDTEVMEFLNRLPRSYKQQGTNGKRILKKAMEGKLPHNIIYRPKKGFGIPLSDWIRKDLKAVIEDRLLGPNELFDTNYIKRLLDEHQAGKANHRKLIWNLFMFETWKTHFLS